MYKEPEQALCRQQGDTGEDAMPTYLLVPLHTCKSVWRLATHKSPIQVIAKNEQQARTAASMRYGLHGPGGGERGSQEDPWLEAKWTYAHVIEQADRGLPLLKVEERAGTADQRAMGGAPSVAHVKSS